VRRGEGRHFLSGMIVQTDEPFNIILNNAKIRAKYVGLK
jgi:hypothetical protein